MTITLLLLATAAGLLALAFWWIRRNNLAVYPVGRAPRELRPLNTGCDLGAQIMAATAADEVGGAVGTRSSGAAPASPGPAAKRRKKKTGPTRRTFLRTGLLAATGGVIAAWGGASLAFLWPNISGGFGGQLDLGTEDEVKAAIKEGGGRFEFPSGRSYVVAYDPSLDTNGEYTEITNETGLMALYQKCVHLGCRVPWCESSKWFECPCHGSRYNRWGEYQFGPAPRGLDRFALRVEEGRLILDTSTVVTGPSRQVGVLPQPPEGPHCTA